MELWMMYMYLKAMLAEAGSNIYQGFEPFKTEDISDLLD
jgi:hypothetical protein